MAADWSRKATRIAIIRPLAKVILYKLPLVSIKSFQHVLIHWSLTGYRLYMCLANIYVLEDNTQVHRIAQSDSVSEAANACFKWPNLEVHLQVRRAEIKGLFSTSYWDQKRYPSARQREPGSEPRHPDRAICTGSRSLYTALRSQLSGSNLPLNVGGNPK